MKKDMSQQRACFKAGYNKIIYFNKGVGKIISFVILLVNALIISSLIFGLIISIKHSFKAGVYSFLLLLINQIYEYIAPNFIESIVHNYETTGMTMGEVVSLLNLIPKVIQFIAITLLVIGLYKMWADNKQN